MRATYAERAAGTLRRRCIWPRNRKRSVLSRSTSDRGPLPVLLDSAASLPYWEEGVGDYAAVRLHSERISALGVRFRVLDLPSLIKAKRAAGRPRDFDHLPELEALLALSKG